MSEAMKLRQKLIDFTDIRAQQTIKRNNLLTRLKFPS